MIIAVYNIVSLEREERGVVAKTIFGENLEKKTYFLE